MQTTALNEVRHDTDIHAMSYSDWNDRLLRYFFGSFTSRERVRITLTDEILDSEFEELGGVASFKKALRQGPEWPADMSKWHGNRPSSLAAVCRGLYRQWSLDDRRHQNYQQAYDDFDAPPYFNYLCAFCLAWTQEAENLSDSNFYDRLEFRATELRRGYYDGRLDAINMVRRIDRGSHMRAGRG